MAGWRWKNRMLRGSGLPHPLQAHSTATHASEGPWKCLSSVDTVRL
jgi:hypothetical protein